MNWPDGKIGPCARCDRIRPLHTTHASLPTCRECQTTPAASSPTAVATDGGVEDAE